MTGPSKAILVGAVLLVVAGLVAVRLQHHGPSVSEARHDSAVGCSQVDEQFRLKSSGRFLNLSGTVIRLLSDSFGRYQHQRFVVQCGDGHTVLIVNDITVGERAPVRVGDEVGVRGRYIWSAQGGLVDYTHRGNGSLSGWILLHNKLYS